MESIFPNYLWNKSAKINKPDTPKKIYNTFSRPEVTQSYHQNFLLFSKGTINKQIADLELE